MLRADMENIRWLPCACMGYGALTLRDLRDVKG